MPKPLLVSCALVDVLALEVSRGAERLLAMPLHDAALTHCRGAPAEGRYLRRHLWATEEISPQHVHILRAFLLAELVARGHSKAAEELGTALGSVRRQPPAKRPRIASSAVARYMAALTPRRAA